MRIWKLHALGNNFVFVRHEDAVDHEELAVALCRRDVSVGADGLLSIALSQSPPMVRMWNPDATADFCGNGLCCAALLFRHLTGRDVRVLDTPLTPVPVRIDGIGRASAQVTIRIRRPVFDPRTIPLDVAHGIPVGGRWRIEAGDRTFDVVPANNGNMHTVIFVEELPTEADFNLYSPLIETHKLFPYKTNVLWCAIGDERLQLRIWERSVGETASCGTGAAAAVVICGYAGYDLPETVEVDMRGGRASVSVTGDWVELTTRATLVFEGDLIDETVDEALSLTPLDAGSRAAG
jgi:diaminopimelate epimerase